MFFKYSKLTITILLLFNLSSLISCYCQGTFFGKYSPCDFQYNYLDINCTVFNFSKCSWSECVAYMRVGNVTTCARYQRRQNSDWGSCTRRCCDQSKGYKYSYSSFQQCEDDKRSKLYLILIIVFSFLGGGIIVTIIVLVIFKYRERLCNLCICQILVTIFTCKCLNNNKINPDEDQQTSAQIQIRKWTKLQEKNIKKDQNCCICLEAGSNFQLQCGHIYHRACILAWMKQNTSCALCKRAQIKKTKVYCQRCFEYYYDDSFEKNQKKLVAPQICDKCV